MSLKKKSILRIGEERPFHAVRELQLSSVSGILGCYRAILDIRKVGGEEN
jgi:hypothetical protein